MTAPTTERPGAAATQPVSSLPPRLLQGAALGLVAAAGAINLAMPFWGDQALFTLYGRELADGAVLYRDVFDLKQPGIFLFYAAAGLTLGFTEVGIHAFELVYWIVFTVFTLVALRPYFTSPWAVALVPVFTVATYYFTAGLLDLTQVEILVAFPLLVAWWLLDQAAIGTHRGHRLLAAAGATAAIVVLFKHLYVLVVLAFFVLVMLRSWRRGSGAGSVIRAAAAFGGGLFGLLLLVVGYFAAQGQLERIWWAYVEWAPQAATLDPQPFSHLTGGGRRFLVAHGPLVVLAALGTALSLRQRAHPQLDLVVGMLVWGLVGAVAVFMQFWGEWHWLLFTVPVGILAVVGLEVLVRAFPGRMRRLGAVLAAGGLLAGLGFLAATSLTSHRWLLLPVVLGACAALATELGREQHANRPWVQRAMLAALALSLGLALVTPADKLRLLTEHELLIATEARTAFQYAWNPAYRAADADLQTIGDLGPGPLFVFGDPVVYLRADRSQAVPIHGWGPEKLDARAWDELDSGLRSDKPEHIVVSEHSAAVMRARAPALLEWVETSYDAVFQGASGTWYARR